MTIGDRIRARREELHLSQDELAKRLGYKSRSSINKIEIGCQNLRQSKIKAIADALDTTPAYIMGWDEFDQQANTDKIQSEVEIAELIEKQYGKDTLITITRILESDPTERGRIGKLLEEYSTLDKEDRMIVWGRMIQIVEDMLAADKYATQKESKHA